jgi:hypothetical protein
MSEHRELTAKQVRASIMRCFAVKRPAFLWGPPGIGKSELVEGITKDLGGIMYDLRLGQMEPTDIRGIPFYNKDDQVMDWAQPVDLPQGDQLVVEALVQAQADAEVELGENTKVEDLPVVVLFLDEMNSAPPSVLAAAYQLILNRRIGKYKLPDNVVVIAAGNRESDKGVTFRMPTPLANRFVHFEMKVSFDDWFEWAVNNGVHKDVVGYLNFAKQDLYDFDPKGSSRAFATPRSWAFVSDLIDDDNLDKRTVTDLVSGTVGEGLALKFVTHREYAAKMPNPSDILDGKVSKLEVNEVSAMYSLVVSMCYELKEAVNNGVKDKEFHSMADNFFRFMMDNFETELVVMGARVALTTYNLPMLPTKLKHFDEFHQKYGKYIIAASE